MDDAVREEIDQTRALLGVPRQTCPLSDDVVGATWFGVALVGVAGGILAGGWIGGVVGLVVAVGVMWLVGLLVR